MSIFHSLKKLPYFVTEIDFLKKKIGNDFHIPYGIEEFSIEEKASQFLVYQD